MGDNDAGWWRRKGLECQEQSDMVKWVESEKTKKSLPQVTLLGFPAGSDCKESACHAGDLGLIPGSGRYPGEGNGNPNPLPYSCLENPLDRGTWWVTVHGVTKSWTWLKRLSISTMAHWFIIYNNRLAYLCIWKKKSSELLCSLKITSEMSKN